MAVSSPVTANDRASASRWFTPSDKLFHGLTLGAALLVLLLLGGVIVALIEGAWPAFAKFGFGFLFSESWNPVTEKFGALAPIYGTLITSVIAMLIGVPISIGIAIFLTEICPMWLRRPIGIGIELLAGIPSIMGSYWMSLHLGWSRNQELSMSGRLMEAEEARELGLVNALVAPEDVIETACAIATSYADKPAIAWRRTKARFREVALAGFDDAFRAGVLGQQAAYAAGEPQAVIDAFLATRK